MTTPTNAIHGQVKQGPLTPALHRGTDLVIGNHRGKSVSVIKTQDVDNLILIQRFLAAAGLLDGIDKKSITDRNLQAEQSRQLITPERIRAFDQSIAKSAASTKLANEYLRAMMGTKVLTAKEGLPRPENNLSSLMQHYMGLQKLANALKEGSDDNFVALLTPAKDNPSTLEALAKNLQEAGDDPEKLASQFEELPLSPDEKNDLIALLKTRHHGSKDELKEKLRQALRQAQNLPTPEDLEDFKRSENKSLLECVENELSELERTFGGRIHASLNALDSAGKSDDGLTFLESYNDLVHGQEGFAQEFMRLLDHYKLGELSNVLPLMKQAIADDLASDQRSTDAAKLHHLLSNMSNMHISEGLIQSVKELSDALRRIFHAPAAAAVG